MENKLVTIYDSDGSSKQVEGVVLKISNDTVKSMSDSGNGVLIEFHNGTNYFMRDATYDGTCLTFTQGGDLDEKNVNGW